MIRNSYYGASMCSSQGAGDESRIILSILGSAAPVTITNIPAAVTEFNGSAGATIRYTYNFLYSPHCSIPLTVVTAGNSTSRIAAQYSPDQVTWNFLGDGTTAWDAISLASTGNFYHSFFVSDACRFAGVVFVRFVTLGGDGAADPVVGGTPNGLELVGMDRRNTTATVPTTGHAYSVIPITLAASATAPRINLATQALFGFDATVWTDMPNALTEIFGTTTNRRAQNFKNFATRWVSASWDLSVAGSANAKFGMQWSLDGGTVWNYADLSANPNGAINGTGCRFFSPWGTAFNMSFFNSANAATALRRWVGLGGDGVADPALTVSNDIVNFYLIDPNGIV